MITMRRLIAVGWTAALMSGCVPMNLEPGAGSPAPPPSAMIPDPAYRPRVGDHSVLFGVESGTPLEQVPLLNDITSYDLFERASKPNANQHWGDLEEQGWLKWASPGTRVLVLALRDRNHIGARVAAEVRVLEGPHKGRTVWTPLAYITQFKQPDSED